MSSTLRWGVGTCALGSVGVLLTEQGVRRVILGDDDPSVSAALAAHGEPPPLRAPDDDPTVAAALTAVTSLAKGDRAAELALDCEGTPFQRRVWDALRAIPRGETRTYAQVAASIGSPRSARAVGGACGANPLALFIPCHRVVGAVGTGGYAWGVDRKEALLAAERTAAHSTRR